MPAVVDFATAIPEATPVATRVRGGGGRHRRNSSFDGLAAITGSAAASSSSASSTCKLPPLAPATTSSVERGAWKTLLQDKSASLGSLKAPPASSPGIPGVTGSRSARLIRRRSSMDRDETPFEAHLADIYSGHADADAGLSFFESHGYYDVSEANTVAMFRQNFDMKKFWDGDDRDLPFFDEHVETIDLAGMQVLSVGAMLSTKYTRNRTVSGRFRILDDCGNEIDAEAELEAERERRMRLKRLELDDDDLAELAQEQVVLAKAITEIRTEKTRFQRFFCQAMNEQNRARPAPAVARVVIPQPVHQPLSIQLPPYTGYLYILKDTIKHLFRSWHKRWFCLDFNAGLAMMYKRSYWKSARGAVDMRTISNITRLNRSDLCIECYDGRSILLRSKAGAEDADLWMNLMQFARRQVGNIPQLPPSTTMYSTTTTTTTTTSVNGSFVGASHGLRDPGSFVVSSKLRAANDQNVLDIMAAFAARKNSTRPITAA